MPRTLTETATVIISSAAMRADYRVLPVPKGLRAPAVVVRKTLAALLKDGLLAEVPAGRDDDVWAQDENRGRTTLVATPDGLMAIGINDAETPKGQRGRKNKTAPTAGRRHTVGKKAQKAPGARKTTKASRAPRVPKSSGGKQTKQSILVAMLRRGGASIDDMVKATGWQPHSVRGVLTATIKNRLNLPLISEKDAEGVRRYHIAVLREGGKT